MNRLHQLFDNINTLIEQAKQENRGRPKRKNKGHPFPDDSAIQTTLIVLLATLKGWNISQTHRNLTDTNAIWRHIIGVRLSDIPPRRTLNYRWNHPLVRYWQQRIIKRMFTKLLNQRDLYVLSVDMSDLPTELYDTLANWGFCGKGYFYGYKLHIIITRDGVPLGLVVTRASSRETSIIDHLLSEVSRSLTDKHIDSLFYLIGDTAYDSNPAADYVKHYLSAQLIAPVNPRKSNALKGVLTEQIKQKFRKRGTSRDKAILLYESQYGRGLYTKYRVIIEQVIDQLKHDFGLFRLPYWIRGVRKVQKRARDVLFAYVCVLYCNKLHRRPLREVATYMV